MGHRGQCTTARGHCMAPVGAMRVVKYTHTQTRTCELLTVSYILNAETHTHTQHNYNKIQIMQVLISMLIIS